ncbi:MAG TPA: DNA alkylation repair protein [Candidatus Limnocylindrales bacterium]|nr:DNA alkylation repair protein [Candidatus Limnocylindrales bacterium]
MSAATKDLRAAAADALGRRLATEVTDAAAVAVAAEQGLRELATEADAASTRRVAPGIDPIAGVSFFLVERAGRSFARATREDSPINVLLACERLFRLPMLEARWLAFHALERLVVVEPEQTWQLMRRASKEAADWITVDALAHPVGRGILAEPFRWAELGALVFSPSEWERRLVGSTIATIPFVDRSAGRDSEVARQALPLVGSLIGDASPAVQKALSWALRSLVLVDVGAVVAFVTAESQRAVRDDDGHRAWVLRDTVGKLPPPTADAIRGRLDGIRKRPGAPSTSEAAAIAAAFVGAGGVPPLGGEPAERIPIGAR